MLQQAISLIENDFHFRFSYILFIILGSNGRCTGQDKLIGTGKAEAAFNISGRLSLISCFRLPARRAIIGLSSNWFSAIKCSLFFRMSCLIGCHLIHGRVSYIVNGVLMLSFEEFHFKKEEWRKAHLHLVLYS